MFLPLPFFPSSPSILLPLLFSHSLTFFLFFRLFSPQLFSFHRLPRRPFIFECILWVTFFVACIYLFFFYFISLLLLFFVSLERLFKNPNKKNYSIVKNEKTYDTKKKPTNAKAIKKKKMRRNEKAFFLLIFFHPLNITTKERFLLIFN